MKKINLGNSMPQNKHKISMAPLVELLQYDNIELRSLSLEGLRLKSACYVVLNALGTNTTLQELDISGNMIGDRGMKLLGKALQINNTLTTLHIDSNLVSSKGFTYFAHSLSFNSQVTYVPVPVNDVSQALKENPSRTTQALKKIEEVLRRNRSEVRSNNPDDIYSYIVTETLQQDVSKQFAELNDLTRSLKKCDVKKEDEAKLNEAVNFSKEAHCISQVFNLLRTEIKRMTEDALPLDATIENLSNNARKHIQESKDLLCKSILNICPTTFKYSKSLEDNIKSLIEGLQSVLLTKEDLESVRTKMMKNISETYWGVGSEVVIELVNEMAKCLTNEIANMRRLQMEYASGATETTNGQRNNTESAPESKNSNRKKIDLVAIRGRKLRPESTITDANNELCWSPVEGKFRLTLIQREGPSLEHISKLRPQRAKNNASRSPCGHMTGMINADKPAIGLDG